MKVLHLITTLDRGGAENQLLILVEEQIKNGLNIEIVPLKGNNELGIEFEAVGATVDLSVINRNPIHQILILRNKLKRSKNQFLIHSHLPRSEMIAIFLTNPMKIFTRHNSEDFYPRKHMHFVSVALSRISCMRSKRGIAISYSVKKFENERHQISSKFPLNVVYYGYKRQYPAKQNSRLMLRNLIGVDKDEILIGSVARLVNQKNLSVLINAFRVFHERNKNSKLVIIGEGPLKEELKKLTLKLNISDKVIFFGRSNKVLELMSSFDLFVLTSKYEGFGLVILEAMDSGCKVLGSNSSAIPEVIGGDERQLFTPNDVEDLSRKMQELIFRTKQESIDSYNEGRLKFFGTEKLFKNTQNLYEEIGFKK